MSFTRGLRVRTSGSSRSGSFQRAAVVIRGRSASTKARPRFASRTVR
jgi:hypothetical protein